MKRLLRQNGLAFFLLFGMAAAVRVGYILDFVSLPLFNYPIGPDVSEYFAEAQRIRAGEWLPAEAGIHAPLYPYVLAGILSICGGELFLTRLLHSLLFALLTLLPVFQMLRNRTAGLSSPVRFLPHAAALILALYPPLVICQCEFFSENLMMVLLLFSLCCFTLHRRYSDALAGGIGGLAVLAHPGCIFYLFFGGMYAGFRLFRNCSGWRNAVLRAASFGLAAILVIAPVCVYHSILAHRVVLIQDNSMFNLCLGNSPAATGTCRLPPGARWEAEFERARIGAAEQGIRVESFYRREFFRYVGTRPLHYLKMLLKKAAMTLSAREFTTWSDAVPLGLIFWHKYLYPNWFLILLLLGGPVLLNVLFRRSIRRFLGPELMLFTAIFAGQIFFLTSGRYRMPLVIPLAAAAGYFLCRPKRFFGTVRSSVFFLGSMIALFVIGSYPYSIPVQMERDYARSLLATAYLQAGNPAIAVKLYEPPSAGECFPERRLSILGQAWYALGDLKRSGGYFQEAVRRYPRQPENYLNYASVLSETGHAAEAEKLLNAALQLHPANRIQADIEYNLGEIAQRLGQPEKAEAHYRAALNRSPLHRRALNNLGVIHMGRKEPGKALPLFERAVMLEPGNVRLQINLALSLAMSGRESEARKIVSEVLRRDPRNGSARKLLELLEQ